MHEKFRLGTMEKEFRTPPHPQKKPQNKKKTHVFEEKTNMYIILRQEKQTFILRYSGKHQVFKKYGKSKTSDLLFGKSIY